jgi:xanthine dehydrogenase YagR molybdenum-binding subunit
MAEIGIGANAQRGDGREKVMGKPIYGADRLPARTVFAAPVAATVGKARITAIDTGAAERVEGVLAVLTYRNMDRLQKVEFSFAGGQAIQGYFPMQGPEVRYRGECIALCVSETPEAAYEAASLVHATYDEQPFAVEMTAASGTEVVQAKATAWFPDFVKGDPVPLIDAAPVSVDAIYYSAAQTARYARPGVQRDRRERGRRGGLRRRSGRDRERHLPRHRQESERSADSNRSVHLRHERALGPPPG